MTLKTSLIITGDSAVAQAAVNDLTAQIEKLGASGQKAAPAVDALATAETNAAQASNSLGASVAEAGEAVAEATGEVEKFAEAGNGAVTTAGNLAMATGAVSPAVRTAANDLGSFADVAKGAGAAQNDMSSEAGALSEALTGAVAPAAEAAAGKVTDMAGSALEATGKGAALAGVLSGALATGLGLALAAAGALAVELVAEAYAADQARDASASLANALAALDAAQKGSAKSARDVAQAHFAAASAKVDDAIRTRELIKAKLASAKADVDAARIRSAGPGQRGELGTLALDNSSRQRERLDAESATQDKAIDALRKLQRMAAIPLLKGAVATATDTQVAAAERYERAVARLDKRAADGTISGATYRRELTRLNAERDAGSAATTKATKATSDHTGAVRTNGDATAAARGAARGAADAQRQLAQDLDGVVGKYDPARKAAEDYREELERIARLQGAGKINADDAKRYSEGAAAAFAKKRADTFALPGMEGVREDAAAAETASKAIDRVIASLRGEIAARQELDPVQRQILKHRDELAKLAPEEAARREAELRGAYAQIEIEEQLAEAARDAAQAKRQLQGAALDALDAIIVGGEKAGDVVKRLAKQLASAALEAGLFGTGPLASLLKGGFGGGNRGQAGGGGDQAAADMLGKSVGRSVGDSLQQVLGARDGGAAAGGGGLSGIAGSLAAGMPQFALAYAASDMISNALGLKKTAGGLFGVLGNAIGTWMAGPAKPGGATVSSVGGVAAMSGSVGGDKAGIAAGSGLAGKVATSINQIVAQLGGAVGSFNVQVGKYKDDLRVNVDGKALGGVKGSGATGFGTDEDAAIKFAVAQAIAQGAVSGVSDQVAKALRSSPDIEKALQEALKVQQIEVLLGGVGGQIEKAFKDFEATAKERVRIASAYGFDVVAIEKRNAADRLKIGEDLLKGQVGSLKKLIDDMTQGSLFEGTSLDKLGVLEGAIGKARADLDAGIDGAGDTLAGLLEQKAAALKDSYGTTSGYADGRAQILDEARAAVARANARIVEAQAKVTVTSDPALSTTNATLDEIADQNARMLAATEQTNRLLAARVATGGGFDLMSMAAV